MNAFWLIELLASQVILGPLDNWKFKTDVQWTLLSASSKCCDGFQKCPNRPGMCDTLATSSTLLAMLTALKSRAGRCSHGHCQ